MGIGIEVAVHRLTRPEGDVVQVDDVVICAAIDKGSDLTVADGQRLLEISGWLVILQHHRCLFLCRRTKCDTKCRKE